MKYEQSSGDPGIVQLLYERAITDFPVSSDLWLDYTRYLNKTLEVYPSIFYFTSSVAAICILIDSPRQVGNVVRDVYSRATKKCPWVGKLWVRTLLSLEHGRVSEEEISTVGLIVTLHSELNQFS